VHAGLVHGSIWLEVALNVELILLKHQVNFLLISGVEDLLKITAHTVLLIMEAIEVRPSDSEHMLSHQLAEHTPKEHLLIESAVYLTCRDERLFACV